MLDDAPRVHDCDLVGALCDHPEVVADKEDSRAVLAPREHDEQLQDLRLHGYVERGGRLVRDEELRTERQRHRDHHSLPHPAGELVW